MKETDIVIRELTQEELNTRKPFAHFGWEGTGTFSFYTISDGYWDCAKILQKRMTEEYNNYSLVDSLIYPMFFNYRHSIETFLKMLYLSYGEKTEQKLQRFLRLGHDLQHLWAELRPILNKGKKHVGCTVDLNAVEHYIKSINSFDPTSMIMRYPINKDLTNNKSKVHHFDFINFGERMNELCDSLRKINNELSNQILEVASYDELNKYLDIFEKYRSKIDDFLLLLKKEEENEQNRDFNTFDFITLMENEEVSKKYEFLNSCDSDLLILLDNLFYGGRAVNTYEIRLSTSSVLKQKEFVKYCYTLLEMNNLCFGTIPEEWQINIFEKTSSTLISGITRALSILDLRD